MILAAGAMLALMLQTPVPPAPQAPPATTPLADAYFFFLQGRNLEGQGDVNGAIAAYRRAIELSPKASSIHAELAGVYARAGRAQESIAEAEAALALDASDREANRILGLVQAAVAENMPAGPPQTKYLTDAAAHLETALAGARDPGAELTLGRLNVRLGRFEKAVSVLNNFLLDNPAYPEGLNLIAEAYERLDRWKDAAAAWGQLAAGATDPTYRIAQASALLNANEPAAARDLLAALSKTQPKDTGVLYMLAQAERRAGNPAGAEAAAKQIASIDPSDPRAALAMAEVHEAARDFAGVVSVLKPLYDERKSQPSNELFGFVAMSLANAYEALSQFDRAEDVLRDLIDKNPSDDVALNALGYMLADNDRKLDDAVTLIKRALDADPENPSYLDSLGWAYFRQGKAADAIAPLEKAVRAVSASSLLQNHLAEAYFAVKRYRDAADTWTLALAGDRDGIDVAAVTKKRDRARALAK